MEQDYEEETIQKKKEPPSGLFKGQTGDGEVDTNWRNCPLCIDTYSWSEKCIPPPAGKRKIF